LGRWGKEAIVRTGDYIFCVEKEIKIISLNTCFVNHRIVSAVKRVKFVSDRMPCIVLRGRWCNVVLNMYAPSKESSDD
jgi:hypothetical protein